MVDLHTIISEAGASGISLPQLKKASKFNDADLDHELKQLRSQHLIAGPFKYKGFDRYYAKGHEPGGDSVGKLVEAVIRNTGSKLATETAIEKKIPLPFKNFFKDGVQVLVGAGRVARLKGGSSNYLLHIDAARQLFPKISSPSDPIKGGQSEGRQNETADLKEQVLHAYHALKAEQGGLGAVSIGKLLKRVGCSKQTLHSFLLEEARAGNADLHPTTVVDVSAEDREAALSVPGKIEPAIAVTLR
jgi:hypothetical protein